MRKALLGIFIFFLGTIKLFSHCQIPCGIYDDNMRFNRIREHVATIEKSINSIKNLEKEKENHNQLVRWINNKEEHAEKIMEIATHYFLIQRIKITDKKDDEESYFKKVELLHRMMVYAMKTKQSLDIGNIKLLRKTVDEFEKIYSHDVK